MTNEDYKALGLPLYKDMVHAFQETDHYNICHRTSEEWTDGAEWVRRIAVDAIKAKEKEMIDKACEWLKAHYKDIYWEVESPTRRGDIAEYLAENFRKAMEEEI